MWRRGALCLASGLAGRPAVPADQGDKGYRVLLLAAKSAGRFGVDHQALSLLGAFGNDQSAAHRQLVEERLRRSRRPGSHQNAIERRHLAPADGAVEHLNLDVDKSELADAANGLMGQVGDPLEAEHPLGEQSQDGGLIPGAGADLEHRMLGRHLEKFGHPADDPRLRNGLPAGDRQGVFTVRLRPQVVLDEQVALHPPHGLEHAGILQTSLLRQISNHALPLQGVRIGRFHGSSLLR